MGSALDYFRDERILTGWNLGDTLDAHEKGVSGETLWGNPKASQLLFDGVKKAGFDIVRIPVTWMGHFGAKPDFKIKEKLLMRVAEVADYAHNASLKVIINMHHDGITSREEKQEGWHSIKRAGKNKSEYERITFQFFQLWKNIALYFKDYGQWLMFESMNEIHDGNWGNDSKGELNVTKELIPQFEIINKWNQVFTDAVRSAAGCNTGRFLIISGYCKVPMHTIADYFILPADPSPFKQIVSFHYYDPYEFCIEGSKHFWGGKEDKKQADDDFAPFKKRFIDNKVPVIIGESGAALQLHGGKSKEETARRCRLDYISYIYSKAKEYGLVPFYWDNGAAETSEDGEKFGLINRKTGKPNNDESDKIIKAITGN